jgi:uncharacterized membrane protein
MDPTSPERGGDVKFLRRRISVALGRAELETARLHKEMAEVRALSASRQAKLDEIDDRLKDVEEKQKG